jgi:hypothetical protein
MRQVQTPVHHFCSPTERDRNILSQRTLRTAAENAETTDDTELSREGLGCAGWHQEIELDSACA